MKIPEIKREIFSPLIEEIDGPQKDPHWIENMFTYLQIHQPIIAEYLLATQTMFGEHAAMTGLMIYRIIETQMEVDELNDLFSE